MRRLLLLTAITAVPAQAAVLNAGAGQTYSTLDAAVRAAEDGDTIHLIAGTYYECATIGQRNVVLEGEGGGTVLTDRTCEGKAILVIRGNGTTVRNLVLARARVPDQNGAGIRLEAQGLTVERVLFDNDEVGLLAAQAGPGTIMVTDCVFVDGGIAGERPTAAVLAAQVASLRIERSRFERFRGTQISTAAGRTELEGNIVTTGVAAGAGSAVNASGGLMMHDNTISLGPNAPPHDAAVIATGSAATLQANRLQNGTGRPAVLLLDWMDGKPVLSDNVLAQGDTLVSSEGSFRHRVGATAREWGGGLRRAAGGGKRAILRLFGR